jgi:hypothetical protein
MPPKQQQQKHREEQQEGEHTISSERKQELKDMLIEHGLEHSLVTRDLAFLDRAMAAGWTVPTNHELKQMKENADKTHKYKHLVTYAVRSAREALGEPVKEKGHHEEE